MELIGRLTRDPEVKALPSGTNVANFSIATSRKWKDKEGAMQEETEFHNVIAFGKTAETIGRYVIKGQELMVFGRLQTRSWEKDGAKQYRTEIICEQFQFGAKAKGTEGTAPRETASTDAPEYPEEDINPEDIPF